MKKVRNFLMVAALATLMSGAGQAQADQRAGTFTLSPMIGYHVFEGDQPIDDDLTFGLGAGYNFTDNWGTELMANYTDADGDQGADDANSWIGTLNALYHLFPRSPISPYLQAGVGAAYLDQTDPQTNFLVNYGLGLKVYMLEDIALRADARHIIAFDQGVDEWNHTDNNVLLTAGLTFQFGGAEPAPEPRAVQPAPAPAPKPAPAPAPVAPAAPLDSDQDGVPDDRDQCPNTVRGVMVDEKGCPISLNIHIEFDFDKAEIKPEFYGELEKAARFIQEHQAPKILVAGHTDSTGTDEYNKGLSDRRAAAVRQFLAEKHNVPADKLVSRGYGESRPIATNETEAGRQQNRRTEIICCVFIPEE